MFMDGKTQYCHNVSSSQLEPKFIAIPIKIPASYFKDIGKLTLKLYGDAEDPE